MSSLDYQSFPFADINDFEGLSFDCTVTAEGYYFLILSFYKQYADDDTGARAEGLIFSTNISALTLSEIDARCEVLFRTGLFAGLHISSHGSLTDTEGNEIDSICWNTINDQRRAVESESLPPRVTIQ